MNVIFTRSLFGGGTTYIDVAGKRIGRINQRMEAGVRRVWAFQPREDCTIEYASFQTEAEAKAYVESQLQGVQ